MRRHDLHRLQIGERPTIWPEAAGFSNSTSNVRRRQRD
jgi:hypothetical protein